MAKTKRQKAPLIGYIDTVYIYHEFAEVRVDVTIGHQRELREIEVFNPHKNIMHIPEEGDYIDIHYVEGKYVAGMVSTLPQHPVPDVDKGDMCFTPDALTHLHFANWVDDDEEEWVDVKLAASGDMAFSLPKESEETKDDPNDVELVEDSFVKLSRDDEVSDMDMAVSGNLRVHLPDEVEDDGEIAESNSYFEFERQEDGTVDLDINITGDVNLNVEQGDADVNVQEGGVSIEANETAQITADEILIGENGEPVAKQNHTHDYDWENEDGEHTSTTDTPNESGTDTLIQ